ncbi:MAG: gliding motility-associated ABC transporter permease subunit GldF [Flavobacteriales bacterium]|nr:gliding motility-associated ABC transporter permease subunit GldF [Flavobacteriales bacterium]
MKALYLKELRSFLNSLVGYISIAIFLTTTGIFLWYFKGPNNILEYGEATLYSLFAIAPYVFMFLIPAITMRSFADEKRNGTIEILLTKPISDFGIILAKFFAGSTLVLFSLLPTLVYYYSIIQLGEVKGNIDHASTWGSYTGLLLLGMTFVAIGNFTSSITKNQIVAFVFAVKWCFLLYVGFQFFAENFVAPWDLFFIKLSIQEHFQSMQKGVIDSRDVIYYFSAIVLFLYATKLSLQSRFWK